MKMRVFYMTRTGRLNENGGWEYDEEKPTYIDLEDARIDGSFVVGKYEGAKIAFPSWRVVELNEIGDGNEGDHSGDTEE